MKLLLLQPQLAQAEDQSNLDAVLRAVEDAAPALGRDDVVLLPEHVDARTSRDAYEDGVGELARRLGCHVVGGSHHEPREVGMVNCGLAVDADGNAVGRYEKLRPYSYERDTVRPGIEPGEFTIAGRQVLVFICADFWFADLFTRVRSVPDLVLVPALSVSRKPTPEYSRRLWRYLAVARAYEFGTFVGISDWGHPSVLPSHAASGVAGLANPATSDPDAFFSPVGEWGARVYELDFDALDAFRADRVERGFFWKKLEP